MKIKEKLEEVRDQALAVAFVAGLVVLIVPVLAILVVSAAKSTEEEEEK